MDFMNQLMVICGWVLTIGNVVAMGVKAYKTSKKPCAVNEEKLETHSKQIKDLQEKADRDYVAINEVKSMQSALVQAQVALMDHEITGNHIDGLKKARTELIKHLTQSC